MQLFTNGEKERNGKKVAEGRWVNVKEYANCITKERPRGTTIYTGLGVHSVPNGDPKAFHMTNCSCF